MSSAILQMIAGYTQAVSPPGPWSFLNPSPAMRQLHIESSELLRSLRQKFTLKQLESARVLVRQQDNNLGFSPVLVGGTAQGLFLWRTKNEEPFDIVNHLGSLASNDPPAFGASQDCFTRNWSGESNQILVTFSDEDLAVLRMLWLPCTPAAGLAEMDGQQVRSLCGTPYSYRSDTSKQVHTADVSASRCQLTLVGCRLAELVNEKPKGLDSVTSRMLKVEEAFRCDTSKRVSVWEPTESEFSRISSAVEFADRNLIRNHIFQSARRSNYSVSAYSERITEKKSTDYGFARSELLRTIENARGRGVSSAELAKRLEALNDTFDREVVDAIVRDAMSAPNSVERSLLLVAADLMGHWHRSNTLVRSTQDGVIGQFHPQEEVLDSEDWKDRLRLVDGLVKIHRELTRGK